MITVTILAYDFAFASAITGINDLLYLAGKSWNKIHNQQQTPKFNVQIASWDGKPIKTLNNLLISPHCSIQEVKSSDVYLVPGISGDIKKTLSLNTGLIEYLSNLKSTNSIIGSNSTGAFFLAEAGLLEHKVATTHWGLVEEFRLAYPNVNLVADSLLTQDDNILCDGGGLAWFDLGLHLIEFFCDHQTAMGSAKTFVLETGRSTQLSYSPLISNKYHKDETVHQIQQYIDGHFTDSLSIAEICDKFGVTHRTLIRRFKSSTGMTPLDYIQRVRLNAASKYLVQTNKTIDEITHAVGYSDISSFTKLFKKHMGLSASHYRARYQPLGQ